MKSVIFIVSEIFRGVVAPELRDILGRIKRQGFGKTTFA
jgi:hypothetical protein